MGFARIRPLPAPLEPLTTGDRERVELHPGSGADLARLANFGPGVQDAIAGHHERMDGSGYPAGHHAISIGIGARILAVAEVYDSMTRCSYNGQASDANDAMLELTNHSGTRYDATVVGALISVLGSERQAARGSSSVPHRRGAHASTQVPRGGVLASLQRA